MSDYRDINSLNTTPTALITGGDKVPFYNTGDAYAYAMTLDQLQSWVLSGGTIDPTFDDVTCDTLVTTGNVGIGTASPIAQLANTNTTDAISVSNPTGFAWRSTANDWASVIISRPASGLSYGLRVHSGGTSATDYPFGVSSGAGSGSFLMAVTGAGNVGIGTTSPSYYMDIGSSSGTVDLANAALRIRRSGVATNWSRFDNVFGVLNINQYDATTPIIRFQTSTDGSTFTERMRLDSSGNLGIGTASPAYRLDVQNTGNTLARVGGSGTGQAGLYVASGGAFAPFILFQSSGTTTEAGINAPPGTGSLVFTTGALSTSRWTINSSGHFLASTDASFDIGASGANRVRNVFVATSVTTPSVTNAGALALSATSTNVITLATNGTERARVTSGGFLKASNDATYDNATGSYHELRQSLDGFYSVVVTSKTANSNSQYGVLVKYTAASPNAAGTEFLVCEDSTALRASIRSNGGIANYSANNVALSDARLKTDVAPVLTYWDKVKAIEVVTFKYTDQSHDDTNVGVIAQQVEAVAPEFVDVDGFGQTPEDGVPLKSIYNTDLQFAALRALQEAMTRIEVLEAKVAQLTTP